MAHKTLIGGTAYEIGGGKTLVNGTAYEIDKGKTLVGGTAYEVGFAPPAVMVAVNITNSGYVSGNYAIKVTILDKQYYYGYNMPATVEVPIGTIITCFVKPTDEMAGIYLNGTKVVGGRNEEGYTYNYTVTTNVAITTNTDKYYDLHLYITES